MVRAAETFLLLDPETFRYRIFHVGDEIPEWALNQVSHPDILDQGDIPEPEEDAGGEDGSEEDQTEEDDVSRETDDAEEDPDPEEYEDLDSVVVEDEEDDQPRPNRDWKKADILEYAMSNGFQVTGSETKDQLLELIGNEG